MKKRMGFGISVVLVLALVVVGLSSANGLFPREATVGGQAAEEAQQVVETFYDAYLAYTETGNPMVDKSYREMPGLSEGFVAEMDALLGGERIMYDPFLCAQDVPLSISVQEVDVQGELATVVVASLWNGNPMASLLQVELAATDGTWEISHIACTPGANRPLTAGETVISFYTQYIQRTERENPLVAGSYEHMPFLSVEFVTKVQETLAGMAGSGFDPILLAQDVPMWVEVESEQVEDSRATVTLRSSFEGHRLSVELMQRDAQWEITSVSRAE